MTTLTLHANSSTILVHAAKMPGTTNMVYDTFYLTDENGNRLTDENGNYLTAYGLTGAVVIHARPTEILLHAGAS